MTQTEENIAGREFLRTFCDKLNRAFIKIARKKAIVDKFSKEITEIFKNLGYPDTKESFELLMSRWMDIDNKDKRRELIRNILLYVDSIDYQTDMLSVQQKNLFFELKFKMIFMLKRFTDKIQNEWLELKDSRLLVCYDVNGEYVFRIPYNSEVKNIFYRGTVKQKRLGEVREYSGIRKPEEFKLSEEDLMKTFYFLELKMFIFLFDSRVFESDVFIDIKSIKDVE